MTFKRDFNGIILHLLRQLVKDALHFEEIVSGSTNNLTHIDVKMEELQSKVTSPFCFVPTFQEHLMQSVDIISWHRYKIMELQI